MGTATEVLRAMQQYGIKPTGRNKYQSNSPLRIGSDSGAFSLTITDEEHGAYYDHVTKEEGSLYDLAQHLGVAIPALQPIVSTKRKYSGIEDYAKAHGLTPAELIEWQWRETIYQNRPALEYLTHGGRRWRFLDDQKPRYKSEENYKRVWYGVGAKLSEMLESGLPLVIANGEISVITARKHGVAAIAMTGGEKGEIPQNLLAELQSILYFSEKKQIIIALDCDKAGRSAAVGIQQQLRAIFPHTRAVDLKLGTGGDLADFCMIHGATSNESLINLPNVPEYVTESSGLRIVGIDEVLTLPPVEWLVPSQIPRRGLMMVYGQSGTYKSFWMLDNAMKLAVQGYSIIYIAAEGESGYRQRVEAWIHHHKIKPQTIRFVLGSVNMFDTSETDEFARVAEVYKPNLIVVDTLAMCSGDADENSTKDMNKIVGAAKDLSRHFDGCISIVHHTNAEGRVERGSKSLRNGADTVIRLSLEDDLIVVQSQKTKDIAAFDQYYLSPLMIPLGYSNRDGLPVSSVVLLPSTKVVKDDNELTKQQRRVLEALEVEPAATLSELCDTCEISNKGTMSRILGKLEKGGLITREGNARRLTPKGESALGGDK